MFPDSEILQNEEWKTWETDNSNITVKSRISSVRDSVSGKKPIIEYIASMVTDLPIRKCVLLMEDFSLHKEFLERTEKSEVIQSYSSNEWLIYYYFTQPWPFPDADCVTKLKKTVEDTLKIIEYYGIASPDLYIDKGIKRMEINEITYRFKELDNNSVKITMISRFSPTIMAPHWMINTWFPEGPIKTLERFSNIARELELKDRN
jgi:hypothetical protein